MEYLSEEQVRKLLRDYYDIPELIDQRRKMIEELSLQDEPSLSSPVITGMPKPSAGRYANPTMQAALISDTPAIQEAVRGHLQAIAELQEKRSWMCAALATLDRADRKILELAYMGPEDPVKRKTWTRRPFWKEIANTVEYSESRTYARAKECLQKLSDLSLQQALPMISEKSSSWQ